MSSLTIDDQGVPCTVTRPNHVAATIYRRMVTIVAGDPFNVTDTDVTVTSTDYDVTDTEK